MTAQDDPPPGPISESEAVSAEQSLLHRRLDARSFVKLVVATVGGAGATLVVGRHRAKASYIPGPPDVVDTDLTVVGDLTVDQNLGAGTSSPAGALDVAGTLATDGIVVVDSSALATHTYYDGASAQVYEGLLTGAWGIVANHPWGEFVANGRTWGYLATLQS